MTWNVVMTQEITLVSQVEQVITFLAFFSLLLALFASNNYNPKKLPGMW